MNIGEYRKTIVSVVMGILIILDQSFGIKLGISEEYVTIVLAALWPVLVWLVPNSTERLR